VSLADSAADRADLGRRDAPDRADDLRERLDQLPPGHPSSPYETDGTPRHPLPRLRDQAADDQHPPPDSQAPEPADRVAPLDDAEWGEHVAEVRDGLAGAAADGLVTRSRFTIDQAGKIWSAERDAIHDSIIEDICGRAEDIPCERQAIIAGGLGGAGKSTVLGKHAGIDLTRYLTINPDDVKEEMGRRGLIPDVPGLSPMEASDLVHEESSHIAKRIARRAAAEGKNVIWDITMSTQDSTEERIDSLHAAGYSVTGIFVDIPVETSVSRAEFRHRSGHEDYRAGIGLGGRYVPPELIRAQADEVWGSQNRKTFEAVRHRFEQWSRYDNSVDGRPAVLAEPVSLTRTARREPNEQRDPRTDRRAPGRQHDAGPGGRALPAALLAAPDDPAARDLSRTRCSRPARSSARRARLLRRGDSGL
jgi:predicted kinase